MIQQYIAKSKVSADIVVVGLGPVGATLANLLGLCGVGTLVLEREADAYHLPRAVHFDDEVMRIFETTGLNDQIARNVILSPGMHFVDAKGKLILDWSRPAEISALGWHPSYRFHQPDLERVLRAGLARWPNVTVRNRCDVFALDADADGVTVHFEDLASGRLTHCRARYVVGCDGARSLVRRLIGSGLHDLGFHERWLVVDAVLKRPRLDLGDYSVQHCDPVRPVTYVRGTGNRRRWEIALRDNEDSSLITAPPRVWGLLKKWITPRDAEIERSAVYTFHSVIAERWRKGKLLLAGDSAHQTPPFLGQGMCAGIRDAANLAWKLARIVEGKDSDALLESYQSERAPHVQEYIELAIRLGGIINTKAINAGLPGGGRKADGPARMESKKPLLGPGLFAGRTEMTGQLAPQPDLSDGVRLDARTGYQFALLMTPDFSASLLDDMRRQIADADVALVDDAAPALQDWLSANQIEAVLVRPDRYVLGGARDHADLKPLLATVFRAPKPVHQLLSAQLYRAKQTIEKEVP
jgi:3-(3-hydroxy-phenyl)propionate hydroxylase